VGSRADIHFHLLPGVDDGPPTEAEAVELARAAVADGTADVVATPHVRVVEVAELQDRVERLRRLLRSEAVELEVHCGGELHPGDVDRLAPSEFDVLGIGPPGAAWQLLEAPLIGGAEMFSPAASELRGHGYSVVIAHPERSPGMVELGLDETLRTELAAGSRIQINATSLLGRHGDTVRRRAIHLIDTGLAHAVASDAHRLERGPMLTPAFVEIERRWGWQVARALVDEGPRRLLSHGIAAPSGRPRAGLR
jgi:protein-tyrosine phosphatase